jgi:transposase
MIALPAGTHIWVACGVTDMRKGFDTLVSVSKVLESLESLVIQGRRPDLWRDRRCGRIKIERSTIATA